jgi:hypothetical protein
VEPMWCWAVKILGQVMKWQKSLRKASLQPVPSWRAGGIARVEWSFPASGELVEARRLLWEGQSHCEVCVWNLTGVCRLGNERAQESSRGDKGKDDFALRSARAGCRGVRSWFLTCCWSLLCGNATRTTLFFGTVVCRH